MLNLHHPVPAIIPFQGTLYTGCTVHTGECSQNIVFSNHPSFPTQPPQSEMNWPTSFTCKGDAEGRNKGSKLNQPVVSKLIEQSPASIFGTLRFLRMPANVVLRAAFDEHILTSQGKTASGHCVG